MSIILKHLPSKFLHKFCLILVVLLGFYHVESRADQPIWNEYSAITEVFNADSSDLDSVRVSSQIFSVGDTVMFIQMKG